MKCYFCQGSGKELQDLFIKFRSGNGFLITLGTFLTGWLGLRHFIPFDPDYGILNLILSIEASVAGCLLLDLSLKNTAQDRETLQTIISEIRGARREIEDIEEEIEELSDG